MLHSPDEHRASNISRFLLIFLVVFGFSCTSISCSSPKTIALTCKERQIEIYVDDEYLGRDLVYYTPSKGQKHIYVSCRDNGVEVYNKKINVEGGKGGIFELQIPKHYKYSSKPY